MNNHDDNDRFQLQPWYVKLWRMRHYLVVPQNAVIGYRHNPKFYDNNFWNAWSVAIGTAQIDMNYVYTLEEVKEGLGRLKDK